MLAASFLDILRCPVSKAPLVYNEAEKVLVSVAARLVYRIEDGVPVLLADEAKSVDAKEIERLVRNVK